MTADGRLAGYLILVLENDYFLAVDESSALRAQGARVLGPFSDSAKAIEAAEQARPHCALMDINLGGGADFVPARALVARGVPIVFVTGYEPTVLPPDLARAPCLQKPFADESLVAMAATVCPSRCER
jgi:CheY-like chemotaxis protein